jgi:hypothetical protein
VFKNREQRRICESKWEGVTGGRKQSGTEKSDETNNGEMGRAWDIRNEYIILVKDPGVKRLFGRFKRRRKDNIKMQHFNGLRLWSGFIRLRTCSSGGEICLKLDDKHSVFIKSG